MSKIVASLPRSLLKDSAIGASLALVCYVALQFFSALLIHCEVMGEDMTYPMVCTAAGISSFVGCGYSVVRAGNGSVLSTSAVVFVFLTLTVAAALFFGQTEANGTGLTGIGVGMVVGGLVAALIPGVRKTKARSHRDIAKNRRVKR